MTDPKVGYEAGILRIIYVSVDDDGNLSPSTVPNDGYNSGVKRIVVGEIDSDGDYIAS